MIGERVGGDAEVDGIAVAGGCSAERTGPVRPGLVEWLAQAFAKGDFGGEVSGMIAVQGFSRIGVAAKWGAVREVLQGKGLGGGSVGH
jgi:hypothetical protein